jgi:cytosine/adenosine deaminase-related metal-dependent hydrolase
VTDMRAGMTFINSGGRPGAVRVVGSTIESVGSAACAGDRVIDLQGDRLLPGLINAHDHLHLNTLPPLDGDRLYRHAREWVQDVSARRRDDPAFEALVAKPRDARLLMGGVKNLLSGVTTVAHHDPLYPFLENARFPVRVVSEFGWSHSLYVDGRESVRESFARTPPERPWIIHAAEGTTEEAAREFDVLEEMGCLRTNTLLVHGVALDVPRMRRLQQAGAGLLWCPSSNLRLFGSTASVRDPGILRRTALGTDSRLSGARDLLAEMRVAAGCLNASDDVLESMVTGRSAQLLRLHDRGALAPGLLADLLVLEAGMPLSSATRAAVRLVVIGGVPRYADSMYAGLLEDAACWEPVEVDGRRKYLDRRLAAAVAAAGLPEPGLTFGESNWRAA